MAKVTQNHPEFLALARACGTFMCKSHDNTYPDSIDASFLDMIDRHITPLIARKKARMLSTLAESIKMNAQGTDSFTPTGYDKGRRVAYNYCTELLKAMAQAEEAKAGGGG